ncbi:MAG: cupin domain-containing protein [Acidobacteriota bacterium]|nr:cupin domain-containing protein [Acidobacteriota bacterium]
MPMQIVSGDKVFAVKPPATVDFKPNNPLARLMTVLESVTLSAERENYQLNQVQYLVPFDYLGLYGPTGSSWDVTDARAQDNKEDFQKQNIKDFRCTDTWIARGWATTSADSGNADWTGPFLFLSYRGGPDSKLSQMAWHKLGASIRVYLRLGDGQGIKLDVPYNDATDRYEIEIWGYPGNDLRDKLDERGKSAMDRGGLIANPSVVPGNYGDFAREGLGDRDMRTVSPGHTMHPVLPLGIELAWADKSEIWWDSKGGANYHYQFNMIYRGWDNFLKVGVSESPHGGFGFLHYRNVLSNYFSFRDSAELGRDVEPWMFDANGNKNSGPKREKFFATDYMDLHILKPECGIGIHRHRDNQEIFFLLTGAGIMVTGDWCKFPTRERCFEIRTMTSGSFSLLKPGNLHALFNVTDEDISLLMFGGYD